MNFLEISIIIYNVKEKGDSKMKYKCIIFDIGYTLVKHNNEIESKMMAEILNIPHSKEFESH